MTHATRFRLLGAAAALALSLGCAQAIAQPTHDQESVTPYAYLKGWDVMSVNIDGSFIGCRGAHYGESGPFMIDYNPEGWRILVAYRGGTDEGTFAGAVLKVDRTVVDAQVGLELPHWAMMFLEDSQLKLLRDGSVASLTVNGQPPVVAKLSGSAAMLLKVSECFERAGEAPKTSAVNRPAAGAKQVAAGPSRAAPAGSAGPSKPAPAAEPDAFDARVVSFAGGRYEHLKDYAWVELGDNGGRFDFTQFDGNDKEIYLEDKSRGVTIVLHLGDRTIYYAGPGEQYRALYRITRVE